MTSTFFNESEPSLYNSNNTYGNENEYNASGNEYNTTNNSNVYSNDTNTNDNDNNDVRLARAVRRGSSYGAEHSSLQWLHSADLQWVRTNEYSIRQTPTFENVYEKSVFITPRRAVSVFEDTAYSNPHVTVTTYLRRPPGLPSDEWRSFGAYTHATVTVDFDTQHNTRLQEFLVSMNPAFEGMTQAHVHYGTFLFINKWKPRKQFHGNWVTAYVPERGRLSSYVSGKYATFAQRFRVFQIAHALYRNFLRHVVQKYGPERARMWTAPAAVGHTRESAPAFVEHVVSSESLNRDWSERNAARNAAYAYSFEDIPLSDTTGRENDYNDNDNDNNDVAAYVSRAARRNTQRIVGTPSAAAGARRFARNINAIARERARLESYDSNDHEEHMKSTLREAQAQMQEIEEEREKIRLALTATRARRAELEAEKKRAAQSLTGKQVKPRNRKTHQKIVDEIRVVDARIEELIAQADSARSHAAATARAVSTAAAALTPEALREHAETEAQERAARLRRLEHVEYALRKRRDILYA